MVICIYISFPLWVIWVILNYRAISWWNFGFVGRLGLGVGVKTSLVMLRGGEIGA